VAIVRPKPELLSRARELDPELVDLLSESEIFTGEHGGLVRMSFEEYTRRVEMKIKALFLIRFAEHYRDGDEKAWPAILIGDGPLRVATFDRWWTLELMEAEDTLERLERRTRETLAPTGEDWFDEWAEGLRKLVTPPTP
jgi:hypothetical protein